MAFDFVTPVFRIVQGNPLVGTQDTEDDEKTLKWLDKAETIPKMTYYVGGAIDKRDPLWAELWGKMHNEGRTAFPNLFDAQGNCHNPKFSWKVIDGDGRDTKGKLYSDREGFAGHYILKISSGYPFHCFDVAGAKVDQADIFYRGCYARANISCKGNGSTGTNTPGIYINPNGIQLIGHGTPILGGADHGQLFGAAAAPAFVPAGMSTTPLAGAPMPGIAPAATGVPGLVPMGAAPQIAPPGAPLAPAGIAPPAPQVAVIPPPAPAPTVATPNAGFVAAALTAPGAPAAIAPAAPAPAPAAAQTLQWTALGQAQGFTMEQWQAQGHTVETLIGAGILAYI